MSTNIYVYGPMRSGKSYAAIILAFIMDDNFDAEHIVFDLSDLQALLPKAKSGCYYISDDIRERFGVGSKQEVVNTVAFLEQCAMSNVSIIFCSPTVKMTEGVFYFIEIIGQCDDFSLGILMDENRKPLGWLKFVIDDDMQKVIGAYTEKKKAFITEVQSKSGGRAGKYHKLEQILEELDFEDCETKTDIQDEIFLWDMTLTDAQIKRLARIIYRRLNKEERRTKSVKPEGVDFIVEGKVSEDLIGQLIDDTEWSGAKGSRYKLINEKVRVHGHSNDKIVADLGVSSKTVERAIGYGDKYIGEAFERYLDKLPSDLGKHIGGQGRPDFVNDDYEYVVSVKLMRGDITKRQYEAVKDSDCEISYAAEKGYSCYIILFLSNMHTIYVLKIRQTDRQKY